MNADRGIRVKRIYEDPSVDDGHRVLVDRLWPRGVSKQDAALDAWTRAVAPSHELRRWYDHDPGRSDEFEARYRTELDSGDQADALVELADLAEAETVTLLTATRDVGRSHAVVLAECLREHRP